LKRLLWIFPAVVLLVTGCFALTGGARFVLHDDVGRIAKGTGLRLSGCELIVFRDEHGGFHGDGEAYGKVKCGASVLEQIDASAAWHEYPMPEAFGAHLRQYPCSFDLSEALDAGDRWFVYDEQSEGDARYSPDGILYDDARHSSNYRAAVYDADAHVLWYFEKDT